MFFLITHDLYIYLFHRLQHHSMLLWHIHSPHDVDWLSGARSHPLEILINQTIEFAPILLLGAAPEVPRQGSSNGVFVAVATKVV